MVFDRAKIEQEVWDYIGEFKFDVEGIVDELSDIEPRIQSTGDIDSDDFVDIIKKHALDE